MSPEGSRPPLAIDGGREGCPRGGARRSCGPHAATRVSSWHAGRGRALTPPRRRLARAIGASALACVVEQACTTLQPASTAPTRLTSDVGWTDYPAISPDGQILAYASDRSGEGNLDIWIQQIPSGPPRRLTRHTADDVDPSFSADGSRDCVSVQPRLKGGIYVDSQRSEGKSGSSSREDSPRASLPTACGSPTASRNRAGSQIYIAPASGGSRHDESPPTSTSLVPQCGRPMETTLLFWGQRDRDARPRTTSTGT